MSAKTDTFITKHKQAVIDASANTTLFPSVIMAQMILESSWGAGSTARIANNFFGIKAGTSWKGAKRLFNTPNDAVKQNYFRVYTNVVDSVKDYNNFLYQNARYKTAGVFSAGTPEGQAKAIAAAGYAESKNYANTLIAIINGYNLKELDKKPPINPITTVLLLLLGFYFFIKARS